MIIIFLFLVLVLIVIIRIKTMEKFNSVYDSIKNASFLKFSKNFKGEDTGDFNLLKLSKDNILDLLIENKDETLTKMYNLSSKELDKEDFEKEIIDLKNKIFTENVSNDILTNNLKFELIKMSEDLKHIDDLLLDYKITKKNT